MQFAALGSRVGAHPHNWPLQIAAEWGLPAFALLLFAILRLGRAIRYSARTGHAAAALTLILMIATCLGLVDGNLVMPVSQVAATLALGLLIGVVSREKYVAGTSDLSAPAMILTAFVGIAASSTVIAFAITSLGDQAQSSETFKRSHPGYWVVPRFWEQGALLGK